MRKRILGAVIVSLIVFGQPGCLDKQPEDAIPAGTNVPASEGKGTATDPFHDRLLQIAQSYETYKCLLEDKMKAAGFACDFTPSRHIAGLTSAGKFTSDLDIPLTPSNFTPPSTAEDKIMQVSRSSDEKTHGKKLYLVFSRYPINVITQNMALPLAGESGIQRVGQAVVKESWVPEAVADKGQDRKAVKRTLRGKPEDAAPDAPDVKQVIEIVPYARHNGKLYHAGRKYGLFIMFKLDPKTPGTDNGWVYGTVSADCKAVRSVGRLESCMKCHQDAPYDRLFGTREKQK